MGRRGIRHEHEIVYLGHKRDRRKIRDRVVAQLAIEARVRGDGAGVEQDGVSVGIGLRHVFGAEVVAGARPVLDEHLLAPHRRELVGKYARDGIRRTSGGDRHDDAHGFARVAGLRRLCARRERPRGRAAAKQDDKIAPSYT